MFQPEKRVLKIDFVDKYFISFQILQLEYSWQVEIFGVHFKINNKFIKWFFGILEQDYMIKQFYQLFLEMHLVLFMCMI